MRLLNDSNNPLLIGSQILTYREVDENGKVTKCNNPLLIGSQILTRQQKTLSSSP